MNKSEHIWILPDRSQSGDHTAVRQGRKEKLSKIMDVRKLPRELVLGVPEELIRKYGSDDPIFAQLVRDEKQQYLNISTCCGKDKEGRVVHLTFLDISNLRDETALDLPTQGLPDEPSRRAETIQQRIEQNSDKWVRGIKEMLKAAQANRYFRYLSNIETPKAHFPPEWTPQAARRTQTKFLLGFGLAAAIASVGWYLLSGKTRNDEPSEPERSSILESSQSKGR